MKTTKATTTGKARVTITIEGDTREHLAMNVATALAAKEWDEDEGGYTLGLKAQVNALAKELIEAHVKTAVRSEITALTAARIKTLVDEVVASGIPGTDQWGSPTGPATPWATYVRTLLTNRNAYGHNSVNITEMANVAVKALLERELKPVLEDAAKQFRAVVDELLSATLKAKIREAAGLGR